MATNERILADETFLLKLWLYFEFLYVVHGGDGCILSLDHHIMYVCMYVKRVKNEYYNIVFMFYLLEVPLLLLALSSASTSRKQSTPNSSHTVRKGILTVSRSRKAISE